MGRPRQPVDVLVANGKKHLTKAEIEQRRAAEVKPAKPARIKVPAWLPDVLKKDFRNYARQLNELGIYSDLDADLLGRYLIAQASWLKAGEYAMRYLSRGDSEMLSEWSGIQDRYYKEATAAARELGLTISSRCRLVIPKTAEEDEEDDLFG